jgi:hypothetical protein
MRKLYGVRNGGQLYRLGKPIAHEAGNCTTGWPICAEKARSAPGLLNPGGRRLLRLLGWRFLLWR